MIWEQHPVETVRIFVKNGCIHKPEYCETCNKKCNVVGHHDDYSKPLSVRWLCLSCHAKHHFLHGPGKFRDLINSWFPIKKPDNRLKNTLIDLSFQENTV